MGKSRFTLCTQDVPEFKLFVWHGHVTNKVVIQLVPNMSLRENLHIYGMILYNVRKQPGRIGAAIASRKSEGKPVDHLREQLSENRRYKYALLSALDDMGWLGPVERITRRMERSGSQD